MPLTRRAIEELKTIYRRKYGTDLSDDEAWEMGHRLVRVFAFLTRRPIPRGSGSARTESPLTRADAQL